MTRSARTWRWRASRTVTTAARVLFANVQGYPDWRVVAGMASARRYFAAALSVPVERLVHVLVDALEQADNAGAREQRAVPGGDRAAGGPARACPSCAISPSTAGRT